MGEYEPNMVYTASSDEYVNCSDAQSYTFVTAPLGFSIARTPKDITILKNVDDGMTRNFLHAFDM